MTRLQKKCMAFSLGLHGLLAVIFIGSAGFGVRPQQTDLQVMTMIPPNIVDRAGAGGGPPAVHRASQPQAQPPAQPSPPQPEAVHVEQVRAEPVERAQPPLPRQPKETSRPQPSPEDSEDAALESNPKPAKRPSRHEVHLSYEPATSVTKGKKSEKSQTSESSARAEARRLKEIENSLDALASGVRSSGSPNTIVDVGGIGGGEAFAGYRDVVFSAYYNAWRTPDGAASRLSSADAKVTIARDGSILSSELVRPSNDAALDRSVDRALRAVTKLPPFPASAHDEQRTFLIRFNLESKEASG